MACDISVVIPVFREEESINSSIDSLQSMSFDGVIEIIVVDGDPGGQTVKAIRSNRVLQVSSEKGRGKQMNRGASLATGELLLFLHADTRLPRGGLDQIRAVMQNSGYVGGSFNLGISSDRFCFRLIEKAASIRSRITRVPYGDQGMFVRKDFFLAMGGFRELPLMEDVEFMLRVRRYGAKIHILNERVETSPRRWEQEGVLSCTLRNWTVTVLYMLGVSPYRLAQFYPDHDSDT